MRAISPWYNYKALKRVGEASPIALKQKKFLEKSKVSMDGIQESLSGLKNLKNVRSIDDLTTGLKNLKINTDKAKTWKGLADEYAANEKLVKAFESKNKKSISETFEEGVGVVSGLVGGTTAAGISAISAGAQYDAGKKYRTKKAEKSDFKNLDEGQKLKEVVKELKKQTDKMRKYSSWQSVALKYLPNSKKLQSVVGQQLKQQQALLNTKNPYAFKKVKTIQKDMDIAAGKRIPKTPEVSENVEKGLSTKNKMYMLAGGATLAGGGAMYYNHSKNKRNRSINQYPYSQY